MSKPGDPNRLLAVALSYCILYRVAGSYLTARLAPYRPMAHATIGGVIGLLFGTAGTLATWNRPFAQGAHWYSIAVALVAIPTAWIGRRLCLSRVG